MIIKLNFLVSSSKNMGFICFGCKKEMGTLETSATKKSILERGGENIPEGMKDNDILNLILIKLNKF